MINKACEMMGISRQTYYNWRKDVPEFAEQVDVVFESVDDVIENALFEKIKEGDTKAIIFACKTRLKKRGYVETTEQKITMDDNTVELVIK